MQRREFLQALIFGAFAGLRPGSSEAQLYDPPAFGNVSLLHITDVHGQLLPVYFREPSVIRVAPTPLYNTFHEVWRFAQILAKHR